MLVTSHSYYIGYARNSIFPQCSMLVFIISEQQAAARHRNWQLPPTANFFTENVLISQQKTETLTNFRNYKRKHLQIQYSLITATDPCSEHRREGRQKQKRKKARIHSGRGYSSACAGSPSRPNVGRGSWRLNRRVSRTNTHALGFISRAYRFILIIPIQNTPGSTISPQKFVVCRDFLEWIHSKCWVRTLK
jgi:hypothetical protein